MQHDGTRWNTMEHESQFRRLKATRLLEGCEAAGVTGGFGASFCAFHQLSLVKDPKPTPNENTNSNISHSGVPGQDSCFT